MWSYHLIWIDPATNEIEIIPLRDSTGHWNVVKFLEQGPCSDCIKLGGVSKNPDGTLNVNVTIEHPFPGLPFYTGFDVRGIGMFGGSHFFPSAGLVTSDKSMGEGEVINADGYATLFNPTTVGYGLEGYIKGKFSSQTAPNSTLNGFKRFISNDPANKRNAFYAGQQITRTYVVKMPAQPNPSVFGYAVDSCWVPPVNMPVTDPMIDFPPEANCPEPWKIEVYDKGPGLMETGGTTKLLIDVFDWQGKDSHGAPVVECPELFNDTKTAVFAGASADYSSWEVTIPNDKHAQVGDYRLLVSIEDNENDPVGKPWMDLTAYRLTSVSVSSGNLIWAKRAGGKNLEYSNAITSLSNDSVVLTGKFEGTATFGHGAHQATLISQDSYDIFIARYNMYGDLEWAKSAGGEDDQEGCGITALSDDSVIVTGYFKDITTFGKGEANEITLTSTYFLGYTEDIFIARYNPDGSLAWVRAACGVRQNRGTGVTTLSDDSVVVTGYFRSYITFNKGEVDETALTSLKDKYNQVYTDDIFIARYKPDGSIVWAKSAGGHNDDGGVGVVSLSDNSVVIVGYASLATFGMGEANEIQLLEVGSFIARYNPDGSVIWAKYVNRYGMGAYGIAITSCPDNSIVVTRLFIGSDTFGKGEANETTLTAIGEYDIFVARYYSDGSLAWVKQAGGPGYNRGIAVTSLSDSSTVVTGTFGYLYESCVTFGPGEANETTLITAGNYDIFYARYYPDGSLAWARGAGGITADEGRAITTLSDNSTVVTGIFQDSATFGLDETNETTLTSAGGYDIFIARFEP
jgi:uncharacterized delta-60 repeat protein